MSTQTYIDRRLKEIQKELDGLKALNKETKEPLPEGFVSVEMRGICPCRPSDFIKVLLSDGRSPNYEAEARHWDWERDDESEIVAYKIVKKHVGPRPMKLAEIPVGVPFARNAEKPSSIWIKTNQGICILVCSEFKNPYTGYPYSLVDGLDYYEVKIKVGG